MRLSLFLLLIAFSNLVQALEPLVFQCERKERNYTESYELKIFPATKSQKAKVFVDERDLDSADESGRQFVKNVLITDSAVLISIEAYFPAEFFDGKQYPPGSVVTIINLGRANGQLRKTETIKGGILSASLGEGTKLYEEQCTSAKSVREKS